MVMETFGRTLAGFACPVVNDRSFKHRFEGSFSKLENPHDLGIEIIPGIAVEPFENIAGQNVSVESDNGFLIGLADVILRQDV